jgi:hypothetical protein
VFPPLTVLLIAVVKDETLAVNVWRTNALVSNSTMAISAFVPGRNAPTKSMKAFFWAVNSLLLMLPELSMTRTMSIPQDAGSFGFGLITRRFIVTFRTESQPLPLPSTVTVPL